MRLYHKDIRDLIEEPYLSRGRDYFNKGKVQIVSVNESQAKSYEQFTQSKFSKSENYV